MSGWQGAALSHPRRWRVIRMLGPSPFGEAPANGDKSEEPTALAGRAETASVLLAGAPPVCGFSTAMWSGEEAAGSGSGGGGRGAVRAAGFGLRRGLMIYMCLHTRMLIYIGISVSLYMNIYSYRHCQESREAKESADSSSEAVASADAAARIRSNRYRRPERRSQRAHLPSLLASSPLLLRLRVASFVEAKAEKDKKKKKEKDKKKKAATSSSDEEVMIRYVTCGDF